MENVIFFDLLQLGFALHFPFFLGLSFFVVYIPFHTKLDYFEIYFNWVLLFLLVTGNPTLDVIQCIFLGVHFFFEVYML